VQGKAGAFIRAGEQRQQSREVWHVSGDQNAARFADETITYPLWRIVWQQSAFRGDRRERIACLPEGVGGLAGAQLAAVPDDIRLHTTLSGKDGEPLCRRTPD
jgi:hypothetical protein